MTFELKNAGPWSYFHLPELTNAGIRHGFCTGLSPWDFAKESVRREFLGAFLLKGVVVMDQEHGDTIHVIKNGERPGAGDGLILTETHVAGIIKTADCLPVIICDSVYPMASIIHAGWRGTAKGIVGKAVREMEKLGARKDTITALLGPSIGPCCYEVRDDVHAIFRDAGFPEPVFKKKKGALFFDLRAANTWVLQEEGIERAYDAGLCTFCNGSLFHSYRRGDVNTRQINFVSIDR